LCFTSSLAEFRFEILPNYCMPDEKNQVARHAGTGAKIRVRCKPDRRLLDAPDMRSEYATGLFSQ
jgi:hypothetical protein